MLPSRHMAKPYTYLAMGLLFTLIFATSVLMAGQPETYSNPIIFADYSDPDVISVDGEFWMTASSFNCVPGLQILHSCDLVNWEIAGAALPRIIPEDVYDSPKHGCGVFAPCIRYGRGLFWIFWGDPDYGIYQIHAKDPCGKWSEPALIIPGKGLIDPTAVFTDDGRVFLAHAWAKSRAGFNGVLHVCELDPDCTRRVSVERMVIDGNSTGDRVIEGPKFYQKDGWFYIFAPAGGVPTGWQLVYRSRDPYGPYERRMVLHQGCTDINGPHQGGWVTDAASDSWFIHFQDRGAWGRIIHLQPMKWGDDGWCTMGVDIDGDGIGEPVKTYTAPAPGSASRKAVRAEAGAYGIPLELQWHANPGRGWAAASRSGKHIRMNCIGSPAGWKSLFDTPNLLLEKITGPVMEYEAVLGFSPAAQGDRAGLVVMGRDYTTVEMVFDGKTVRLQRRSCRNADKGGTEKVEESIPLESWKKYPVHVKVRIEGDKPVCTFQYSHDGRNWHVLGEPSAARQGVWIGAKVGFFALSDSPSGGRRSGGHMDIRRK